MAGISSKTALGLENKKKYNGIEFDNDLDINTYEAFYRNLDPQIGRWWQIDPKIEDMELWSPYVSNYNNPIINSDPLGDCPDCWEKIKAAASDLVDATLGAASALLDNQTHGLVNLRQANGKSVNNPTAFNRGQDIGDMILSPLVGAFEAAIGAGAGTGGALAAPATGGTSLFVSAKAALVITQGVKSSLNGINNYINQKDRVQSQGDGNYGHLKEPKTVAPGKPTTPAQRKRILEENKKMNNGELKSDGDGRPLNPPKKNIKGEKADMNQAEVDHIDPKSKGGSNSNFNQRVISKEENLKKGNRSN